MSLFDEINAIPIAVVADKLNIRVKKNYAFCFNGHDRKGASLHFSMKKNLWYCFACGFGGSNLQLVKAFYQCDIWRAVEWFQFNFPFLRESIVQSPRIDFTKQAQPAREAKQNSPKANPEIYQWILENLSLSSEGETYLNRRGFTKTTIQYLQIKDIINPSAFFKTLREKWSLGVLANAGLVRQVDINRYQFLWWKHVIIFPFFSKTGSVTYLQGRCIDDRDPRYVNLCGVEKSVFNLRALNSLLPGDEIFLMEGVTDTITAIQNGLNAFGILGANSFKPEYVKEFVKYKIRVIPDNDAAGIKFSNSIKLAFQKVDKKVAVLSIAPYKDYSEFSKEKNGTAVNR